ncbi:MAG TPA: hypothetical protein VFW66_12785 [Gemmatimonadales bacterium]|nr:hypothetical protein [Gemmatimonadales bacterium]
MVLICRGAARAIAIAAGITAAAGCYRYEAVTGPAPVAGQDIRADLSSAGTSQVRTHFGPNVAQVDGKVLDIRSDTLLLAVTAARTQDGFTIEVPSDTVALPRAAVTSVSKRSFALGQSALVGGLLAGGAVGAVAILGSSDAGGFSQRPPGPVSGK